MGRREQRYQRGRVALIVWSSIAAAVLVSGTVTGVAVALTTSSSAAPIPTDISTPTDTATPDVTPVPTPTATATPTPVPPTVPSPAATGCDTKTTMSIWAHYDDDLIFMNPAVSDAIDAGDCVRTVFVTGGDAGRGAAYAKGRELGILRAYNTMRGKAAFWHETRITLLTGQQASLWSPDDEPKVTLVFLHLPDGAVKGEGFDATGHASLIKLMTGKIASIAPIDGGPAVTEPVLVASLAELIEAFDPAHLWTHVPGLVPAVSTGDHTDHATVGTLVRSAAEEAGYPLSQVSYLVGYPSEKSPANVTGKALGDKVETFRVYAANDPVVACADFKACLAKPRFGDWLQRHYVKSDQDLFPNG